MNQRRPSTVIEPDNPSYRVVLPWGVSVTVEYALSEVQDRQ